MTAEEIEARTNSIEAAESRLQELITAFGIEVVEQAWNQIKAHANEQPPGPPADDPFTTPSEQHDPLKPELARLQEILQDDLPYYYQGSLQRGDQAFGQTVKNPGYNVFIHPAYEELINEGGRWSIWNKSLEKLGKFHDDISMRRTHEERADFRWGEKTIYLILVKNVGELNGAAMTALALQFQSTRRDEFNRASGSYIILLVPNHEADEVLDIYRTSPHEAQEMVMTKLDPNLIELAPITSELHLHCGVIEGQLGESRQELFRKETIILR